MQKQLKNIRLILGYNQQEMADILGCNLRTYRGYEYETRSLPNELLSLLNKKLHVNINWLLTGTGSMFISNEKNTLELQNDNLINNKILSIGSRLQEIQEKNSLANKDMAKLLGIYEEDYVEIKEGKKELSFKIINRLRQAFKISLDWLFYGD